METPNLAEKVDGRIAYWTNELRDLPADFSQSAYERMKWIRETVHGLHEMKVKFCRITRPLDPEELEMRELLY